jgi:mannose-6-phosphate isomerase-like protein (cupin superfamily)
MHVHHRLEDCFYLAAGRLAIRCGDAAFVAEAGDNVSLPMGVPHTLRVLGHTGAGW